MLLDVKGKNVIIFTPKRPTKFRSTVVKLYLTAQATDTSQGDDQLATTNQHINSVHNDSSQEPTPGQRKIKKLIHLFLFLLFLRSTIARSLFTKTKLQFLECLSLMGSSYKVSSTKLLHLMMKVSEYMDLVSLMRSRTLKAQCV